MMSIPEDTLLLLLEQSRRQGQLEMLRQVTRLVTRDLDEINRMINEIARADAPPGPAKPHLVR